MDFGGEIDLPYDTLLGDTGLDIDYGEYDETNVLHIAAARGLSRVVNYLIDVRGMEFERFIHGPLHYAMDGNSSPLFRAIDGSIDATTSQRKSQERRAVATVTELIKRGANPSRTRRVEVFCRWKSVTGSEQVLHESPLRRACNLRCFDLCSLLLNNGAHPGTGEIFNPKLVLDSLQQYRMPDDDGVIEFTMNLINRMVPKTTSQSPTDALQHVIYLEPLEELLNFRQHSPSSLFVAYALLRTGVQVPAVVEDVISDRCKLYMITRSSMGALVIYLPFLHSELTHKDEFKCLISVVEEERREGRLFFNCDGRGCLAIPEVCPDYDVEETMKAWRAYANDMENWKRSAL
ncbi:hypothetical protein FLAG1_07368 [Fusarium langsethiae]|uniref:Ankyrin repeat protein n=1 Tax=Fusarium langsethiae TaxID=179993 RepID=A0A0N0DDJ3_FUSLA|nr:hypothetical protein FLAG1_07368 [Fusarium langsethiae]